MFKVVFSVLLLSSVIGCASTSNEFSLPIDDIDIQYYPDAANTKNWRRSEQLVKVANEAEIPGNYKLLGTLEIIKNIDECESKANCNAQVQSPYSSSEYLDHYAKKVGAQYAQIIEENKIRLRQNEVKHCKLEADTCDMSKNLYEAKEVCTVILSATMCKMEKVPIMNNCQNKCLEYEYEAVEGFNKTQRTIALLYRNIG